MTKINLIIEPNQEGSLIFYPGHLLKGTAEMILDQPKTFRGFYVTVFGSAQTQWSESRSRVVGTGDRRRTEHYTINYEGKEIYLNSRTYLIGQFGGTSFEIQPGIHRYNFTCQLPERIPYTAELKHGSIRYYVDAVIDIPWGIDEEVRTPFTVVRYDDLNLYPELRVAQKHEELHNFCCFLFCQNGTVNMTATIPYTGFALGQEVPIRITYENKSDVEILSTKIKLKRLIKFTTQTPEFDSKEENERVVECDAEGVKAGQSNDIETILKIPQILMCSNEKFCQIITVSYTLIVEADASGCHFGPEISFPVVIGSVPFGANSNPYFESPIPINSAQIPQIPLIQPQASTIQPSAPIADMDDLPPSFEDAMKMPKPENMPYISSSSGNIGWSIAAPANEKQ